MNGRGAVAMLSAGLAKRTASLRERITENERRGMESVMTSLSQMIAAPKEGAAMNHSSGTQKHPVCITRAIREDA